MKEKRIYNVEFSLITQSVKCMQGTAIRQADRPNYRPSSPRQVPRPLPSAPWARSGGTIGGTIGSVGLETGKLSNPSPTAHCGRIRTGL